MEGKRGSDKNLWKGWAGRMGQSNKKVVNTMENRIDKN